MLYQGFRSFTHKLVAYLTVFVLVFSTFFTNGFFITNNIKEARAEDLCQVPVDVILVMDTSGSMADGAAQSRCEWENLELIGPSYKCVSHTDYNKTESWCQTKHVPQCGLPAYYPAIQSKINSAKSAASSFLNNLGANDQSALVSFADTATPEKALSNNHSATESAINSLTTGGSTNIGDAIVFATNQLNANGNDQAVRAMILLTDGKANKPSTVPDPELYAEQKAGEAAALGYKIFTIGLGSNSDINEILLQNIANETNAQYYHAANGNDLSGIYNSIAFEVCQYGSISGCKWNDLNGNGSWIDEGIQERIGDWAINLFKDGELLRSQKTGNNPDEDIYGCYQFSGLTPGIYKIIEEPQIGWTPTFPQDGFHSVEITGNENIEQKHFGNFNNASCELLDTPGECSNDGLKQHDYSYNYALCGENYSANVADDTCACLAAENLDLRQCVGNNQAEIIYEYNFDYCPQSYTDQIEDLSCGSDYVCGEWADVSCVNNGVVERTRDCTDQYGTPKIETQEFQDSTCDCVPKEVSRVCSGNGFADVTYTYGAHNYCGEDYLLTESDGTCASEPPVYPVCGNGTLETGEACDDGNLADGDGCSLTCAIEQPPVPICGDGSLDPGEECDDNNLTDNDGCDNLCQIETAPEPFCGDGNLDSGEQCDDDNTTNGDGCDSTCQTEQPAGIQQGDIVINEIMQNPYKVPDASGEWFELYNTTDYNIDLNSCVIADSYYDYYIIGSSLIVPAHDYVVLGSNGDKNTNGGVDVDYQYAYSGPYKSKLNNTADQIILNCGGLEIDLVEYDGGPNFPNPDGKSMVLAHPGLDNNIGSNWCVSSSVYGAGDKGTPGALNDPCPGFTCNYTAWQDNECVSDGQRQQDRQDNSGLPFCLELTQEIPDPSCACIYSDWTAGQCVSNTSRSESRTANFSYCTDTNRAVEDATCAGTFPTFGSISVYKYLDLDGNLQTSLDQTLSTSTIWTFFAEQNGMSQTTTTAEGIANFRNLPTGDYTISEEFQNGWYLLGTNTATTTVSVLDNSTSTISFYNSPSATISGYKFEDLDAATTTVADLMGRPGWVINLFSAASTSTPVATTTTDSTGYFEFKNLLPGEYTLTEVLLTDWQQLSAPTTTIVLTSGANSKNNNFINYYTGGSGGEDLFCGDNIKNNQEQCDGTDGVPSGYHCLSTCVLEAEATGGGGYNYQDLIIANEAVSYIMNNSAVITWLTNKFATSRVIYDTVSHPDINGSLPPNYNYLYSTLEIDNPPMVTGHAVVINGLLPGTTYYFRPVSHASPEKYGQEISFTTTGTNTAEFDQSGTGGVGGEEPSEDGNNAAEADGKSGGATTAGNIAVRTVSDTDIISDSADNQATGEQSNESLTDLITKLKDDLNPNDETDSDAKVLGASTCKISWWLVVIIILIYLSVIYRYYRYWQEKKFKHWYVFPIIFTIAAALFVLAVFKCWL